MGKPEAKVERLLKKLVEHNHGECLKFVSGVSGVPDRIVILNGHVPFVELKAPGEKPTPLQRVRHAQMRAAGAVVYVIDTEQKVTELVTHLMTTIAPGQDSSWSPSE